MRKATGSYRTYSSLVKLRVEDLPLGRIAAMVPEFAVKDLPLGRTLMMMMMIISFIIRVMHATFPFVT